MNWTIIIKALAALALLVIGFILVFGTTTDDTGVSREDTQRTSEERQTNDEIITSQVCPQETCIHQHSSRDFTMPYSSELNLNSSCDEIKDYILVNLERINTDAFHSSDDTRVTGSMKKELIFILENRSDMITNNGTSSPGIRFKFCCPTEENCLL